jgi:hypothetical protein
MSLLPVHAKLAYFSAMYCAYNVEVITIMILTGELKRTLDEFQEKNDELSLR